MVMVVTMTSNVENEISFHVSSSHTHVFTSLLSLTFQLLCVLHGRTSGHDMLPFLMSSSPCCCCCPSLVVDASASGVLGSRIPRLKKRQCYLKRLVYTSVDGPSHSSGPSQHVQDRSSCYFVSSLGHVRSYCSGAAKNLCVRSVSGTTKVG